MRSWHTEWSARWRSAGVEKGIGRAEAAFHSGTVKELLPPAADSSLTVPPFQAKGQHAQCQWVPGGGPTETMAACVLRSA